MQKRTLTILILPQIHLCLRKFLVSSNHEMRDSSFQILLPIHEAISQDDPQPIMALFLTILSASLEPHLRHIEVLLNALATEEHSAQHARRSSCEAKSSILFEFLAWRRGRRAWGVSRPDETRDAEEVGPRTGVVSWDCPDAFAA